MTLAPNPARRDAIWIPVDFVKPLRVWPLIAMLTSSEEMLVSISCFNSSFSLTIELLAERIDNASANSPSCSFVILPSDAASTVAGSASYRGDKKG